MFVISVIFNVIFNTNNLSGLQKTAVFTGVCLLVLANLLFIGSLFDAVLAFFLAKIVGKG